MNWRIFLKTARRKLSRLVLPALIVVGEGIGVVALVLGLLGWLGQAGSDSKAGTVLASQEFSQGKATQVFEEDKEGLNQIAIDVSGAVEKPGLYSLPLGSRVAEAIALAGGVSARADQEYVLKKLNLANKLSDQDKVYIPFTGESQQELTSDDDSTSNQNSDVTVSNNLISINEASLEELTTLPGIGEVRGQEIIDNRPYSNINDLTANGIVGETVLSKIKDLISL